MFAAHTQSINDCRKKNAIELAVRQQGSQAARASTEQAAEQAAKEGSAVGLLRVVLKEYDNDNVHMLQLAAKPLLLQELKVCRTVTACDDMHEHMMLHCDKLPA